MNPARIRRLAGIPEVLIVVPVFRQIGLRVEATHRRKRDRGEASVSVRVDIDAGGLADSLFGSFLKRGRERLLRPSLLRVRGMTFFEDVRNGIFSYMRLGIRFLGICHASPLTFDDK